MGGFDELIEHLLCEIALVGSQGERVTFRMYFIATSALAAKELEFETQHDTRKIHNYHHELVKWSIH